MPSRNHPMTFESALAVLASSRANLSDVVEALCQMAGYAQVVGDLVLLHAPA